MEWDNTNRVVEQIWDKNPKIFINKILSVQAVPSVWNKLFKKKLYIENNISTIEGINLGRRFNNNTKTSLLFKKC